MKEASAPNEAAPAPTDVELPGSPRDLKWPALCANCGAAASDRLAVTKVFQRRSRFRSRNADDPLAFAVTRIDVPFCAACSSRHRQLAVELSPVGRFASYLRTLFVIPIVISAIGMWLFVRPVVLNSGESALTIGPNVTQFGFFAFVAAWSAVLAWWNTRRFRIPPQTEITRAFDFTDWRGNVFSRRRRTYLPRNQAFAEAFRAANQRDRR